MPYTPQYPGGWRDLPDASTPIIAAALNKIDAFLATVLFGAATDPTEDGAQAAGAIGKYADSGHVHPFAGGMWVPADDGWAGANVDPSTGSGGGLPVAGNLYLQRLVVRKPQTITNLIYLPSALGSDTGTGTAFVGLLSSAASNNLLSGSSNLVNKFNASGTAGNAVCPLTTPQAVVPGVYYSACLFNLTTTQPTLWRSVNTSSIANHGLTAASFRWAINGTGLSSIPGTVVLTSNATTSFTFCVGWN